MITLQLHNRRNKKNRAFLSLYSIDENTGGGAGHTDTRVTEDRPALKYVSDGKNISFSLQFL